MADLAESERTDTDGRVSDLVGALTRAEKLSLVSGTYPGRGERTAPVVGYLPPVRRLGVPPLRLADGPLGVRSGTATAFPASIALGATFDASLASAFGRAVGSEARAKGIDVVLAPGCNLVRAPQCGRAFEYYGEDPHHSGRLAAATVRGLQSRGVVATPKHYVANNQERRRVETSAEVSERALRELYLRAFETAVDEGDAGAVMAAYNRINGTRATQHSALLTDILRDELGFEGPVMSDWWAVHDGVAAARAGLDLEMPGVGFAHVLAMSDTLPSALHDIRARWPEWLYPERLLGGLVARAGGPGGTPRPRGSLFARSLPDALEAGTLETGRLDEMVRRVLRLHERVGALSGTREQVDPDRSAHRALAKRLATRGAVLLKRDEGALPLDPAASVAMIGPNVDRTKAGGGGSSAVTPERTVSPATGVRQRAIGPVTVEPGHTRIGDARSLRSRFLPSRGASGRVGAAQAAAASADVAVVVVQENASEGSDRETPGLPGRQDRLIEAVAGVAERTVVVLQTAGPVEMPWLPAVDAVLELWYPGQEAGRALAAVLYGDVDPGGRLPVTFAAAEDYPTATTERYPGVPGPEGYHEAAYDEGVFVGYRFLDDRGLDTYFPFGHGLSYTSFKYERARARLDTGERAVTVTVTNTGTRRGRAVPQVYARPPADTTTPPRPPQELVGFTSVGLAAGETRTVELPLDERAFARYDTQKGGWVVDPGEYTLGIGSSSRDIRRELTVDRGGS